MPPCIAMCHGDFAGNWIVDADSVLIPTFSSFPERLRAVTVGVHVFVVEQKTCKIVSPCAAPPCPRCYEGIPERPLPILTSCAREHGMEAWI